MEENNPEACTRQHPVFYGRNSAFRGMNPFQSISVFPPSSSIRPNSSLQSERPWDTSQDQTENISPSESPSSQSLITLVFLPKGNYSLDSQTQILALLASELPTDVTEEYILFFCVWLLSRSKMFLRFIQVVALISRSFLLITVDSPLGE